MVCFCVPFCEKKLRMYLIVQFPCNIPKMPHFSTFLFVGSLSFAHIIKFHGKSPICIPKTMESKITSYICFHGKHLDGICSFPWMELNTPQLFLGHWKKAILFMFFLRQENAIYHPCFLIFSLFTLHPLVSGLQLAEDVFINIALVILSSLFSPSRITFQCC